MPYKKCARCELASTGINTGTNDAFFSYWLKIGLWLFQLHFVAKMVTTQCEKCTGFHIQVVECNKKASHPRHL